MKYAWVENDRIRDIAPGENPQDYYTAEIAAYYNVPVPDNAQNGWVNNNGVWEAPPPPPPPPVVDPVQS